MKETTSKELTRLRRENETCGNIISNLAKVLGSPTSSMDDMMKTITRLKESEAKLRKNENKKKKSKDDIDWEVTLFGFRKQVRDILGKSGIYVADGDLPRILHHEMTQLRKRNLLLELVKKDGKRYLELLTEIALALDSDAIDEHLISQVIFLSKSYRQQHDGFSEYKVEKP